MSSVEDAVIHHKNVQGWFLSHPLFKIKTKGHKI